MSLQPDVATVSEATAKLWTAQEPAEIVAGLRGVHEALLLYDDDDDDSRQPWLSSLFDPSDVFLAVQGASLRGFEHRSRNNNGSCTDHQWSVLQESIWTIAALTRVCVGPAWWYQALQRRRLRRRPGNVHPHHRQITPMTLPDDSSSNIEDIDESSLSSNHDDEATTGRNPPQSLDERINNSLWLDQQERNVWYPPIPDILPAALLRFTANASAKALELAATTTTTTTASIPMTQRIKLVEAQLFVIRQICCANRSGNYDTDIMEWNIPGAHETVGMVLAYCLKLVCTGREESQEDSDLLSFLVVDDEQITQQAAAGAFHHGGRAAKIYSSSSVDQWKYILLVSRATTDLITSGWRPLPWGRDGQDAILALLVIACRGIQLVDLQTSAEDTSNDARQERLEASSCAAEALSALLALATRGLIPSHVQKTVVRTACRLHAVLSGTVGVEATLLYPLFDNSGLPNALPTSVEEEQEEIDHQIEFFASQRELCMTDTSDVLWGMLAHETSVEQSITVLFSIIEIATQTIGYKDSVDSPLFNTLKWNDQTDDFVLKDCSSSVKVISHALFGVAPDFSELSTSLRIFWHSAIQSISLLLSTVQSKVAAKPQTGLSFVRSSYFTKQVRPVVVDAMAALERVVNAELRGGNGILSAFDWEILVDGIENAVVPWLAHREGTSSSTTNDLRMKTESLLIRVSVLLENCARTGSVPLADYACLRRLFLVLLRNSSALDKKNTEIVDLAVIRAWAAFGFFPYRLEVWAETVSELLGEVFLMGKTCFLHSRFVQLEALELLTFDGGYEGAEHGETNTSKSPSLLVMTRHVTVAYQRIVADSILPLLKLILVDGTSLKECSEKGGVVGGVIEREGKVRSIDEQSGSSYTTGAVLSEDRTRERSDQGEDSTGEDPSEDATDLQLYAVKLAGRLFNDRAGNRQQRSACVVILDRAASVSTLVEVRVEALKQLVSCLSGSFSELSFAHESTTSLVDALCSALASAVESIERGEYVAENISLATNVLGALGRLKVNEKGALALMLASHGRAMWASSLVSVHFDQHSISQRPERTMFSFANTTNALMMLVCKSKCKETHESGKYEASLSPLRWHSFNVLSGYLRLGLSVSAPARIEDLTQPLNKSDFNGVLATFNCLSLLAQRAVADQNPRTTSPQLIAHLFSEVFGQAHPKLTIRCCRPLFALLSSVSLERTAYDTILNQLQVEVGRVSSLTTVQARLVATLLAILNEALQRTKRIVEPPSAMKAFELCCEIISTSIVLLPSCVGLHLALRYALAIIRGFKSEEAKMALQQFHANNYPDRFKKQVSDSDDHLFAFLIVRESLEQQLESQSSPSVVLEEKMDDCRDSETLLQSLSMFEKLTIEGNCLEKFVVADADAISGEPCAAWLCENNVVLTCRMGSPTSRYRNYLEVVVRSPTVFKRSLIPMLGKLYLEDPDFPLLLESEPQLRDKPTKSDFEGFGLETDSTVLDRATSLLDRFDMMFAEHAETVNSEMNEASSSNLVENEQFTEPTEEITVTSPSDAPSDPPPVDCPVADMCALNREPLDPLSVRAWLYSVFDCDEAGGDDISTDTRVERHLRTRDFSISSACSCEFVSLKNYKFKLSESKRLSYNAKLERSLAVLDRATPANVYKFGVLYLGRSEGREGTTMETRLLGVVHCSPDFHKFTSRLGEMISTRYLKAYSAGLDTSEVESDGRYALAWSSPDSSSAVVFHVAPLMPEGLTERKRHIGNDSVLIVFVDRSIESYLDLGIASDNVHGVPMVSGQFSHATIIVKPLCQPGMFLVSCVIRAGLPESLDEMLSDMAGDDLVGEEHVAQFVRGLAIRIDLVCRAMMDSLPPPTNSLDRSRLISMMQRYVILDS